MFETTSDQNLKIDNIIRTNPGQTRALRQMNDEHTRISFEHIVSLNLQGRIIASINEHLCGSEISRWTKVLDTLATPADRIEQLVTI